MAKTRRGMDPLTCGHIDYTKDELEFMAAIEQWRQRTGRRFPAWSEVLTVLRDLGYRKTEPPSEPSPVSRKRTSRKDRDKG